MSETFGEGKTENVASILSGYSSLTLLSNKTPRPDPVPPPRAVGRQHYPYHAILNDHGDVPIRRQVPDPPD